MSPGDPIHHTESFSCVALEVPTLDPAWDSMAIIQRLCCFFRMQKKAVEVRQSEFFF